MALLDRFGRPIKLSQLTQPVAAPALGDVTSVWTESVVSGLNPRSLATILSQSANGYPDRYFLLAAEMEERDLHYGSVLATRKLAITGVEPIVVPASKSANDKTIAQAVTDLINQPQWADDYLADLLDALGKGYSLIETEWDRSGKEWSPKAYHWRDQRHFTIDRVDGRTLRRKVPGSVEGEDLPPFLFSIHQPKRKSGLPIRGGLARLAAWAFLFKSFTLKDWMGFLEVYGMPLRVGKYGKDAGDDDKRVLLRAVRNLASDAAAIIPTGMEIEFIEAGGGSGNAVFGAMADYLDKQVSKGVLGQTMSSDDGASLSQARVHENVRHDIARADCRQASVTTNRDLIRPFVDLNFGPQENYPLVVFPITEAEDIKALADVVDKAVRLGATISADDFRERLGFGNPEPGAAILRAIDDPNPLPSKSGPPKKLALAQHSHCTCGEHKALASDDRDELDLIVEDALGSWEADMTPLLKPVRDLFAISQSYDEFAAGLEDIAAKLDAGAMADRLGKLLMKARGLGEIGEGR